MAADADHLWLTTRVVEELVHRGVAQDGAEIAVERTWRATTLDVTQDGHSGFLTEAFLEHRAQMRDGDRPALSVAGAFGNDHDVGSAADGAAALQHPAHRVLPVTGGWPFGDQHEIGARGQSAHECEVPTVAPHHLDDE